MRLRVWLLGLGFAVGIVPVHAQHVPTKSELQRQEAGIRSLAQALEPPAANVSQPPQNETAIESIGPAGSYSLDEVTVTGTLRPARTNETSTTVYTVDRKEIEDKGANSVGEAIQGVPGVQSNVFGAGADVHNNFFIRGLPNLGIGILVDGRLITNLNQEHFDLSDLPVYNTERIEVLTGSGTTLYGTNAAGGVINVITRKPTGPLQADLKVEFGGYGYSNYSASYGGKVDKFGFRAGYRQFDTTDDYYYQVQRPGRLFTGNRPNAYQHNKFYDLNLSYDFDDRNRLRVDGYLRGGNRGIAPFSILDASRPFLDPATGEPQFEITRLVTQAHGVALTYDGDLGQARDSQLQVFAAVDRNLVEEFSGIDLVDRGTFTDISVFNFQIRHNWQFNPTNNITYGFEFQRQFGRSGENSGEITSFDTGQDLPALFALYTWKPLEPLVIITAGVRATFVGDIVARGLVRDIPSSVDPSVGFRYQLLPGLALRGNYQRIYRAPNFNDLFGRTTHIGNPFLEPESGNAFDIGLDWQTGGTSLLRLTYFTADVNNLTDYLLVRNACELNGNAPDCNDDPRSNAERFRVNYPRVNSSGLEAAFNWKIAPAWSTFATTTLVDSRLVAAPDPATVNNQLVQLGALNNSEDGTFRVDVGERNALVQTQYPLVPFLTSRLGITYEPPGGLRASVFANISGGRSVDVNHVGPFDTLNPARLAPGSLLPGYTTVDLSLRFPLTPSVALSGYVFNLFNSYYERSYGNPGPGINFRVGLSSTF
ncbi:TonB-dependent receptor plug domain-containing protein [Gloeobacter morelensis]|uniref:TonB-dependent receptor n=1 Tax=Gloeobacter morelensis MG652769 TaxID=2781736 RepID=A0ABY3PGX4_9CYAN|nr:TonB-dependent receptor [Gloeobacter morelensis]UFP92858.1 TonB-dependent receptor [Gloeobacter morelensis MG652769]